jgi:hypothetical protein
MNRRVRLIARLGIYPNRRRVSESTPASLDRFDPQKKKKKSSQNTANETTPRISGTRRKNDRDARQVEARTEYAAAKTTGVSRIELGQVLCRQPFPPNFKGLLREVSLR